jgi:hypothetical protein
MEQLGKHIFAEMNTSNNRRAVLSVQSVRRVYKKDREDHSNQLSFEMPAYQDVSLGIERWN